MTTNNPYGAPTAAVDDPAPTDGSDALKYILPVGRSAWALAAGYLALFAIFLIPAPAALFCGIMALREISKNPRKLGKVRAIFGIVMGIIGTALLAILLVVNIIVKYGDNGLR